MAYNEALAEKVRRALAGTEGLTEKKMFGGIAFLVDGAMRIGVDNDDLIVRCAKDQTERLLEKKGVREFDLSGGRPMKGWLLVGPEATRTAAGFEAWIELTRDHAHQPGRVARKSSHIARKRAERQPGETLTSSPRAATIEALLAPCPPRVRRLAEAARQRILAVVPDAVEKLRAGWGLIGYSAPGYFAFVLPMSDHVRIGFEWGVMLPDRAGLLQGTGAQVRYVVITRQQDLRAPALALLIREAAALRPPARATRLRRR